MALGLGFAANADVYAPQLRTVASASPAKARVMSVTEAVNPAAKPVFRAQEEQPQGPEAYGTLTTIIEEDFSLMTEGEVGNPYLTTPDGKDANLYDPALDKANDNVWQSMKPGYTHTEKWGAHYVYQAGGCVYLNSIPEERDPASGMLIKEGQQADLNPTLFDNTDYDPYVIVRFKARAAVEGELVQLMIEGAETFDMGPGWDIFESAGVQFTSAEWNEYTAVIPGSGETIIAHVVSMANPCYIDDFQIIGINQFVGTPVTTGHTNYKSTSFDVNWEPSRDAESYLLTVTTYNEDTGLYDKVIDNKNVGNATTYTVNDVIAGVDYYYTVTAVKGQYTSYPSTETRVRGIEAPQALPAVTINGDNTYTATWPAIPAAERYNYKNYVDRRIEQDGEYVIFDEDFENILDPNGETGVIEFEDLGALDGAYDGPGYLNGLSMGSWEAYSYWVGNGYLAICSFFLTERGEASQLESPDLDLSADGGKFKMSIDLRSHDGRWPEQGILPGVHELPQAIIAIAHWDETVGDYVVTAQYYTRNGESDLTGPCKFIYLNDPVGYDEWKTYNFEFEGGTERTKIIIFAYGGIDYLAIDNLKLTQQHKKGDIFRHPIEYRQFVEGTSIDVELPGYVKEGEEIYHQLEAVRYVLEGYTPSGDAVGERVLSGFGPLSLAGVASASGVENIEADGGANVVLNDGVLTVEADEAVKVYDTKGMLVASSQTGALCVTLPARGVYMVAVGADVTKVVY